MLDTREVWVYNCKRVETGPKLLDLLYGGGEMKTIINVLVVVMLMLALPFAVQAGGPHLPALPGIRVVPTPLGPMPFPDFEGGGSRNSCPPSPPPRMTRNHPGGGRGYQQGPDVTVQAQFNWGFGRSCDVSPVYIAPAPCGRRLQNQLPRERVRYVERPIRYVEAEQEVDVIYEPAPRVVYVDPPPQQRVVSAQQQALAVTILPIVNASSYMVAYVSDSLGYSWEVLPGQPWDIRYERTSSDEQPVSLTVIMRNEQGQGNTYTINPFVLNTQLGTTMRRPIVTVQ